MVGGLGRPYRAPEFRSDIVPGPTARAITLRPFRPLRESTDPALARFHVEAVREYIRNQEEHHKQEDFQTEYRRFCEKNGKPVDERYAWD